MGSMRGAWQRYDKRKIAQLLKNAGIVRNRLKIASAVRNAQALLRVQNEFGSFDRYVWQFMDGRAESEFMEIAPPGPAADCAFGCYE